MDFWTTFWALTLAIVLILYTGLFLWVTAGGLADIRAMLRSLEKGADEGNES